MKNTGRNERPYPYFPLATEISQWDISMQSFPELELLYFIRAENWFYRTGCFIGNS